MNDMERLANWLEAAEAEAKHLASRYNGQAEAYRMAAIKARFAVEGEKAKLNPEWVKAGEQANIGLAVNPEAFHKVEI